MEVGVRDVARIFWDAVCFWETMHSFQLKVIKPHSDGLRAVGVGWGGEVGVEGRGRGGGGRGQNAALAVSGSGVKGTSPWTERFSVISEHSSAHLYAEVPLSAVPNAQCPPPPPWGDRPLISTNHRAPAGPGSQRAHTEVLFIPCVGICPNNGVS